MSETDAVLVARWKAGDADAFNQLLARHETRVAAYLAGWVSVRSVREDLFQEVFMRILAESSGGLQFLPVLRMETYASPLSAATTL